MRRKYYLGLLSLVLALVLSSCGQNQAKIDPINHEDKKSQVEAPAEDSSDSDQPFSFEKLDIEGSDILTGQALDSSIFSESEITMVNVWATFCQPCVAEMPDLGRLAQEGQGDFQILGVVIDTMEGSSNNYDHAQEILSSSQANFKNLSPSRGFLETYGQEFQVVPTSFFVNKEGKLVGQAKLGAGSYEEYKALIEKNLESLR